MQEVRGWNRDLHHSKPSPGVALDGELNFVTTPKGMPKKQKLGGQTWSVHFADNLLSSRGMYGVTIIPERMIIVDCSVPDDKMRDILFHELIHVCFSINDSWTVAEHPPDEEVIVRALCPVLLDFLRSNKQWW